MALVFNSPPNWPTAPQGWTPPQDWQPDPAWGPAPDGWQFWVDDGVAAQSGPRPAPGSDQWLAGQQPTDGKPNKDAWKRAGLVALGWFLVFGAINLALANSVGVDPAQALGWVMGVVLLALLAVGFGAWRSARRWGWGRYIGLMFVVIVLLNMLSRVASNS